MKQPVNIWEWRERARQRLPRLVFDYLDGGAEDESALRRNRSAIETLQLVPALLNDTSKLDVSTELFGQRFELPIAITPTGFNGLFWPDGDVALARAAAGAQIPFTLSTPSNARLERIPREAGGTPWMQLYVMGERSLAEQMMQRANDAGFAALILTADTAVSGYRERDVRNGFKLPLKRGPRMMLDVARRPGWLLDIARHGVPQLVNLSASESREDNLQAQAALLSRTMDRTLDWDAIAWIRRFWKRPLLLKGVLCAHDAVRAIDYGIDGVIVSNHGGRQLDSAPATIEVLPEIAAAVQGRVPVLVDSGFRRGADVVKALALGARAVLIGRTTLYGLAASGEAGVHAVLGMLRAEIERTMILVGARSVADLNSRHIRRA